MIHNCFAVHVTTSWVESVFAPFGGKNQILTVEDAPSSLTDIARRYSPGRQFARVSMSLLTISNLTFLVVLANQASSLFAWQRTPFKLESAPRVQSAVSWPSSAHLSCGHRFGRSLIKRRHISQPLHDRRENLNHGIDVFICIVLSEREEQ